MSASQVPNTTRDERFDWGAMLRTQGCTHPTPRGPVAHWDGELIADNPRLIDIEKEGFSMADTELKVDGLRSVILEA